MVSSDLKVVISTAVEQMDMEICHFEGVVSVRKTHISPPLLCSHACFLSIVGVCLGLVLECFFEGLCYVVVAEASKAERSCDFAVLLGHWLARSEEGAKGIETDEEVLFRHGFDGQGG
jgi:hypothetical protein